MYSNKPFQNKNPCKKLKKKLQRNRVAQKERHTDVRVPPPKKKSIQKKSSKKKTELLKRDIQISKYHDTPYIRHFLKNALNSQKRRKKKKIL